MSDPSARVVAAAQCTALLQPLALSAPASERRPAGRRTASAMAAAHQRLRVRGRRVRVALVDQRCVMAAASCPPLPCAHAGARVSDADVPLEGSQEATRSQRGAHAPLPSLSPEDLCQSVPSRRWRRFPLCAERPAACPAAMTAHAATGRSQASAREASATSTQTARRLPRFAACRMMAVTPMLHPL